VNYWGYLRTHQVPHPYKTTGLILRARTRAHTQLTDWLTDCSGQSPYWQVNNQRRKEITQLTVGWILMCNADVIRLLAAGFESRLRHWFQYLRWSGVIAPRIINLGTRRKWVINFTARPLYPRGKSPWYPICWVCPKAGLDALAKTNKISSWSLPGIEARSASP
jgi:hypothetical protein